MTRIGVLPHSFQHAAQIRASISAPSEPGSPTFPAPSRSWPHRAQTTTATRSSYKRPSPKPADSPDRGVPEKGAADHVPKGHRAERPAVGALLGAVPKDGAGPVGDGRDPLQHEVLWVSGVTNENDLPHPRRPRVAGNNDPIAGPERGFHASARHGDATRHGARLARRPRSGPASPAGRPPSSRPRRSCRSSPGGSWRR